MDADWDFAPATQEFAADVHRRVADECGLEYDLGRSALFGTKLSFYPEDTWFCHLDLAPQTLRIGGRVRQLKDPARYYMVVRISDPTLPIIPLGDDPAWVLRANSRYGLDFRARRRDRNDTSLSPIAAGGEDFRSIMEYLHFYYRFTRYTGFFGGPTRFRVPRQLDDVGLAGGTDDDRARLAGALWRFLDPRGTDNVQPAIGTVTRFIDGRYHADVPIQVMRSLWQLRVTILKTGKVRLYRRVPFFASPALVPPRAEPAQTLPVPRGLFWHEPWLWLSDRTRAGIGVFAHFAVAASWIAAALVAAGFSLTLLFHPALVAGAKDVLSPWLPIGWRGLWLCALYAVGMFGIGSACVFQLDGVLTHLGHVAPGVLQAIWRLLTRVHDRVWNWFRPRLDTPLKKAATAAAWLAVSASFLVLAFTTLQVAQEPASFSDGVKGLVVMRTFFGHATIAVPGVPYLLGAVGLDPLPWLKDPDISTGIVFWFRVLMLVAVFRACWRLLGYTPPRVLWRDSRRLERAILRQQQQLGPE